MNIVNFLKAEFNNFSLREKIFFLSVLFIVTLISLIINDSKVALISALAGISYTILAGKGKVSCYFIGMIGTFCYSYLAFKNGFYGNLALYLFYYFPMEIIGIIKWLKHLKKDKQEIIKTKLEKKYKYIYFSFAFICSIVFAYLLKKINGNFYLFDSFITIFSILGQFLTVKRCIEQWYAWFIVNFLSLIMWIFAYQQGSNCFATILMWSIYLVLTFYFLDKWKKEL